MDQITNYFLTSLPRLRVTTYNDHLIDPMEIVRRIVALSIKFPTISLQFNGIEIFDNSIIPIDFVNEKQYKRIITNPECLFDGCIIFNEKIFQIIRDTTTHLMVDITNNIYLVDKIIFVGNFFNNYSREQFQYDILREIYPVAKIDIVNQL